jgi:hypothetical protein
MKNKLISLLVGALCASAFVGCGSDNKSVNAITAADGKTTPSIDGTWILQNATCNNKSTFAPEVLDALESGLAELKVEIKGKIGVMTSKARGQLVNKPDSFTVDYPRADQVSISGSANTTNFAQLQNTYSYQVSKSELSLTEIKNKTCPDGSAATIVFVSK